MSYPIDWPHLASRITLGYVKALSIRQPYPHHIFHDGKDVENRDWPTRGRGWVLIHAGQRSEDAELVRKLSLPLGGIVGITRIVDCVQEMDSRWFFGPYGFVLADARPIDLVPCKGALGFFLPPQDVLNAVAEQVKAMADG